ncbi:cerebellar degeneration-related protein 2-like isoform X2 [Zophobas morio]|uniref:cerebellar degeneration-related protein 2-like isoform X2 n=1 Tax=Zophobas morio TaxID=2755281 RepID=UPI0030829F9C
MASFRDLQMDWASLCQDCPDCWTAEDLQLAAELGKTLLERNKELEIALKQHQNVIEDQAQEIEYLTKQTVALREVSDSRLRIYEQLEVSIQDLERANHRLALENSAGKKHIKTLTTNIETLETRCEELQTTIDDLRLQMDALRKRAQRPTGHPNTPPPTTIVLRHVDTYDGNISKSPETKPTHTIENAQCVRNSTPIKTEPAAASQEQAANDATMEQISQLMAQLRESKTQASRDQRRITELEEQLATMIQQNQALENQVIQLHHRDDDMKSMYDEFSTLEEVRRGKMCSRCLRNIDRSSDDVAEDDDSSILENLMTSTPPQLRSSFSLDVQERQSPPNKETGNLYKDLVEKYEALLEVHRQPLRTSAKRNNGVSLQEELQMSGDFSITNTKDTDEESGVDSLKQVHPKARMTFSHTPTDFSEAETSSSGFSDETSNKYTQTDDRPGSFLCTIADGEDRFSIYNDASPISTRFKNQPEYQELFKEIFTVLKNTPEKTEVPKIEEKTPPAIAPEEVSQITELDDDSQSVVSSTMSELSLSQNEPTTIIENIIQAQNQPIPEAEVQEKPERVLKPLVRQPLEYLSVEVRKRSSSRRKNKFADRSDSPVTHIIGSPKINYSSRPSSGRRRRDFKNPENDPTWNGNTIQFWSSNRNIASPTPSQGSGKFEYRPSLASQELHKLKKLDLSYAEVVRKADNNKKQVARQRRK